VAGAREVVVLSGVRTAVGKYGGSLKDMPPADLGAAVVREAVRRSGVEPAEVGHVVFGNVIHTETRDMYLSRVASVNGGLPVETPAFTLNRLCGSGLQAIVSAAQLVMLGDTDVALAGGAESMSRGLYGVPAMRWGARMGETTASDMMVGALTDPFDDCHMGVTAENVAGKWGISREDQDALAVQSHQRAAKATAEGWFKEQILPIELKSRKGTTTFDTDEHIRGDASVEAMAKLRPVFDKNGSVTAGNAAGINEAFAAQALAVVRDLSLPEDRTNPNGSGVSLGHPIGATGCILTVKALYELQRTGGRRALVTMCIGGGQGIAAIFERAA
jgi:acetyl-CoA C-acetyltransferase